MTISQKILQIMKEKDEHFKDLTIVPTILRYKNGEISQDFDIRCPNSVTPEKVKKQISKHMPRSPLSPAP